MVEAMGMTSVETNPQAGRGIFNRGFAQISGRAPPGYGRGDGDDERRNETRLTLADLRTTAGRADFHCKFAKMNGWAPPGGGRGDGDDEHRNDCFFKNPNFFIFYLNTWCAGIPVLESTENIS